MFTIIVGRSKAPILEKSVQVSFIKIFWREIKQNKNTIPKHKPQPPDLVVLVTSGNLYIKRTSREFLMCQQVCYSLLLTTVLVENRINKNHVAYLWAHLNSLHQFYTFDLNIKHLMLTLFKRSLLTVERPEGTERMYVPSF